MALQFLVLIYDPTSISGKNYYIYCKQQNYMKHSETGRMLLYKSIKYSKNITVHLRSITLLKCAGHAAKQQSYML